MKKQVSLAYALTGLLTLAACSVFQGANPLAKAETVEQKAYAAYGTFVIYQEKSLDLARNDSVPRSIRLNIINAEEMAKPVADSLLAAVTEFDNVRAEYMAGQTTEERFVIVTNNLNNWTTRLVPLTNQLITAFRGAR